MIYETKRLLVREILSEDFESIHSLALKPEIYNYQSWGPNSEKETAGFIKQAQNQQNENPRKNYELAMIEKSSGILMGLVSIRCSHSNIAEIGYWLRVDRWKEGFGFESVMALVTFGFQKLSLNKFFALVDPQNIGSLNLLNKVGFKQNGFLKENKIIRGKYADTILLEILKSEFEIIQSSIKPELILLEEMLHNESNRKNTVIINKLLTEDFLEIGSKGVIFTKDSIVDSLKDETNTKIEGRNYRIKKIDLFSYLVIYEVLIDQKLSMRSSIWKQFGSEWKMTFHQGTAILD